MVVNNKAVAFSKTSRYMKEYWYLYAMLLPAIIYVAVFCYIPMYGVQIAFRDYSFRSGISGSEWVGLKHFYRYVTSSNFLQLIGNTAAINILSLVLGAPQPIIFAIMLNELRSSKLRKSVQMLTYMPHFISVVAVCSMVTLFLDKDSGIINRVIVAFGGTAQNWLSKPEAFRTIFLTSSFWQQLGWNSVIYFAALSSVDTQIVEASVVDGANKIQRIWHIDLPTIRPTIVILLIMSIGQFINIGLDKILLLQNKLNMDTSDVISTYVYRLGVLNGQFSYTAAIGLFNTMINIIMLLASNCVARKLNDASLW